MAVLTDKIISRLIRFRGSTLAAILIISAFFAYFLFKIEVDNDPTKNAPPDLEAGINYKNLNKVFPSPRTILLIAQFDSAALHEKIDSIAAWAQRFDAIDGVDNVVHIGSAQIPVSGGLFGLTGDYLISRRKKLSDEQIRKRVRENREITGTLISNDESTLTMIMDVDESKNQVRTVSEVDRLANEIDKVSQARIYITGAALYAYSIDRSMQRDFMVLLPLCLAVVFALLFVVFRRLSHVFAALFIISIALIWTFGLMGITAMPFSVVTSIIPIILFPIGVATAIHVYRTHARLSTEAQTSSVAAIQETFRELMKPIFLSAITTFVGFASFSFSRIGWTRTFGIFTSIGVALALLLSIILLPIFLSYQKRFTISQSGDQKTHPRRQWLMGGYKNFILSPVKWIVMVILIIAIGIIGFLRVRVEGNPIAMFPPKSDIRKSDALIEKYLGGTRFLFILLEHKHRKLFSAEQWHEIQEIVDHAESIDMVGRTASLLPLINKVSMVMSDTSMSNAALAMLLKSKGLLGKKFESFVSAWVSPDRKKAKIALICKNVVGTEFLKLSRSLKEHIEKNYPDYSVLVAGPPVLNDAMTYVLIDTQIQSLTIAFISVFIVLCVLFRSIKVGLFAVIPIILSTLFVYALMGFFGVAINPVTVIIVNTCIGIGIDYAIHFVAGYLYVRSQYANRTQALMHTASIKGSVIMFNTFVVGIGFLILGFSSFPPIRDFGFFVFISMVASSTFSLAILPVLFRLFGTIKTDIDRSASQ
jgi:hydrophobe/amphiphile efflux-3 (HAE3) family protein